MTDVLNTVLTLILNYGYPIILLSIAFAYIGVPIPLNAILLAGGAFSTDGTLNIFILIPVVILAAVCGDIFGYFLGRKFKFYVINRFTRKVGINENSLVFVESFLKNWGVWCIFFTRWLLTPLGIPVNLMAGISNYSFRKFLIFAIVGECVWAGIYIYTGYLFGANWYALWSYLSDAPQILVFVVIGIGAIFFNIKMWRNRSVH